MSYAPRAHEGSARGEHGSEVCARAGLCEEPCEGVFLAVRGDHEDRFAPPAERVEASAGPPARDCLGHARPVVFAHGAEQKGSCPLHITALDRDRRAVEGARGRFELAPRLHGAEPCAEVTLRRFVEVAHVEPSGGGPLREDDERDGEGRRGLGTPARVEGAGVMLGQGRALHEPWL
jgi:hypothetical protein